MLRFNDVLDVDQGGGVVAKGPRDATTERIVDLCAWVFQRGDHDAAATEMTHHGEHLVQGGGHLEVEDDRWTLQLAQIGDQAALGPGDAFAVAVALLEEGGKQRVVWWGHPVKLKAAGTAGT
jgi:hypothetical protein